jgi:hypothetical protein
VVTILDPGFKLQPGVGGFGVGLRVVVRSSCTVYRGYRGRASLRSEVAGLRFQVNFITYGIVFMGCFSVLRRPRRELPARLLSVRHSPVSGWAPLPTDHAHKLCTLSLTKSYSHSAPQLDFV